MKKLSTETTTLFIVIGFGLLLISYYAVQDFDLQVITILLGGGIMLFPFLYNPQSPDVVKEYSDTEEETVGPIMSKEDYHSCFWFLLKASIWIICAVAIVAFLLSLDVKWLLVLILLAILFRK